MQNSHLTMQPIVLRGWAIGLVVVGTLLTISGCWLAIVPHGQIALRASSFAFLMAAMVHMIAAVVSRTPTRKLDKGLEAINMAPWYWGSAVMMGLSFVGYLLVTIGT